MSAEQERTQFRETIQQPRATPISNLMVRRLPPHTICVVLASTESPMTKPPPSFVTAERTLACSLYTSNENKPGEHDSCC